MRVTRRGVISTAGAALALPAVMRHAHAAQFTWKFGHSAPLTFPLHIRLVEAAARIKQQSNGRMDLQIFPNGQLGGDNDLLSEARSGAIQFCQPTGQILATILPVTAISALGFLWSDYDKLWPAMDGGLGQFIRAQIIAKTGLVPMERMWDLGFRQITSNVKPIQTAADLAGLKIRVPVAPSLVTLFQTLKAAPLALQFPELYSALQTHIADAQENPVALIVAAKLYEVQKYCSITNHVWDGHWISCNAAAWKGLPDDLKTIVANNLNQSALDERADIARLNASLQSDLEKKGMAFNKADAESFRKGLHDGGFYKYWKSKLGDEAWQVMEKFAGQLA